MASAAEQLAANLNFGAFGKAEDLKKRLWFTLGALLVYRLGTYIPLPGIDPEALRQIFNANQGVLAMFNVFAGGAVGRMAIFALNIMPYISASIIIQLLTAVVPELEKLKKEGEQGRKQINQYTRYLTVVLAVFQSWGIAVGLQSSGSVVANPGLFFVMSTVITLTGGTMFMMWLGEQITQRGVGNGISLIIFAGIVAELPSVLAQAFELGRQGVISTPLLLALLVLIGVTIVIIVFCERAQRRLLIQYPKRQQGNKVFEGNSSHLPLKVDQSGVIAVIFAVSLLSVPYTIGSFNPNAPWAQKLMSLMNHTSIIYQLVYVALIIFFCYFYNSVSINPKDLAENMKKWGGFIPGIRPGEPTASHIEWVLNRITLGGALFVSAIAVLPDYMRAKFNVPFYFGGTSLLIVVGVALDTIAQTEAHLVMRNYEGFYKNSKIKGRWFNVGQ
ncbi:MAG: preprotein translocase subunit SecY [Xanthobacteraceae bacterium]|nr:MAG: preprotein translocase subunit SecY [Xanthobacteraceae bacterium]